ncbi:MAG: 3-dehydroquinate synthase [Lachnospiraceae bacterium]|nr:3-dehydroquinate synthase [Lachnospiraceae bacterium]
MNEAGKALEIKVDNKLAYEIRIEESYRFLSEILQSLDMQNRKFMILTDRNVGKLYAEQVEKALRPIAKSVAVYPFPAGEKSKNLDTVKDCYEQLILHGFDRKDILIALGGGVVGDLTGFVASTYLRGIRFVQVPTTLLAMVDSSIGGKTGVDFNDYKNMVGAFYQPKLVYINLAALKTLPANQYYSGMGEIIKHGLIKDCNYYTWIKEHTAQIKAKDYTTLAKMIYRSCRIKKEVVEEDPKEAGVRALLNFGHTIGHSVEKLKNFTLLHGECVSIGMAAAAYISLQRGDITEGQYKDLLQTLQAFEQPITVQGLDVEAVLEATKLDKKMDAGQIKFILLKEIGEGIIDTTVSEKEIREAIQSVMIEER